jgi:hypothetical protein
MTNRLLAAVSDPSVVSKTPLVTVFLLEGANANQLLRMWHEHTAAGQSLIGWLSVWVALLLWANFYRVCCPRERFAFWATVVGVGMNTAVWLTVIWFRFIV